MFLPQTASKRLRFWTVKLTSLSPQDLHTFSVVIFIEKLEKSIARGSDPDFKWARQSLESPLQQPGSVIESLSKQLFGIGRGPIQKE